ncbi:hypothetical protein RMHFA_04627 (plasmid) [Roseomonas mucosa]|uniref:Uncharacterized protein n=1 Tax=Roseomonas mucosa TaxID=207340 RepID=A0A4Y1MR21_9PROT|nr:hypothetical protein RADP37_04627 [Roseomonas mucosa]UZO99003.1 hypothetical protein RMHFA_04627 [Roseomonas mucosa]
MGPFATAARASLAGRACAATERLARQQMHTDQCRYRNLISG